MLEKILDVLEKWKDLQPNMASEHCRSLLAKDLKDGLEEHINQVNEDVVFGAKE